MFIKSFLPIVISLAATLQTRTFTFENDRVGAPPPGFEFARTGNGPKGKWTVEPERGNEKNHVLLQSSANKTDYRFPVAVLKNESLRDVTLSVRARPLAGVASVSFQNWIVPVSGLPAPKYATFWCQVAKSAKSAVAP